MVSFCWLIGVFWLGFFFPLVSGEVRAGRQAWVLSPPLSPADLPGGTVQSAGKPWQQPSCPCGGRLADQELPDIQGPRHQGPVPTKMACDRRQCPQGSEELCKFCDFWFSTCCFLVVGGMSDECLVRSFPPEESSVGWLLPFMRQAMSSALVWMLCCF